MNPYVVTNTLKHIIHLLEVKLKCLEMKTNLPRNLGSSVVVVVVTVIS